ncbi:hypothetical protein DM558_02595 [Entomomonas moraniae]|uniref:Uncharacterized protein n=1 Tax=Entomomonas moraniae TaxID=2213226 RepID=A0A3S9XBH5_9GAMM|nr:hypothetical protein [Entomomonas moraniae]AZS49736.1 hypothetical protein DM558_02595 [Entomomonas moraniae]
MKKLSISDGQIRKINNSSDTLIVEFVDWQEKSWEIIFQEVLAYQNIGAENEDLADLIELPETNLSKYMKEIELDEQKINFCFISAWTNFPILIILADSYIVREIS